MRHVKLEIKLQCAWENEEVMLPKRVVTLCRGETKGLDKRGVAKTWKSTLVI